MTFPEPPRPDGDNVEEALLGLVEWQVSFGPRYPGSAAHEAFRTALAVVLGRSSSSILTQDFTVPLRGNPAPCTNICALFRGTPSDRGPLLIGTHFDTRLIGDNEPDEARRSLPIPGANDGGSGTAILLHLAPALASLSQSGRLPRDVQLVLFDAEDVGHLDGNEFGAGAAVWASNPPAGLPSEMIGLDMVGGKDMVLDIDAHIGQYRTSLPLTKALFSIGSASGHSAFSRKKDNLYKYIISDHAPFMVKGIPSCILIDIDYPQWHTQEDLPEHVSGASMAQVEDVILKYMLL